MTLRRVIRPIHPLVSAGLLVKAVFVHPILGMMWSPQLRVCIKLSLLKSADESEIRQEQITLENQKLMLVVVW